MMKAGIAKLSANQMPNIFARIDMANQRTTEPQVPGTAELISCIRRARAVHNENQ